MQVADAFVWCKECRDYVDQVTMEKTRGGFEAYECAKGHLNELGIRWGTRDEKKKCKVNLPNYKDVKKIRKDGPGKRISKSLCEMGVASWR